MNLNFDDIFSFRGKRVMCPAKYRIALELELQNGYGPFRFWKEDVIDGLLYDVISQEDKVEKMIEKIIGAEAVYVSASGRSGLSTFFGMTRIAQMGIDIRDTSSPTYLHKPVTEKDVIVGVSGSGKTLKVLNDVDVAKKYGAEILAVTGNPKSPLSEKADVCVVLKTKSDKSKYEGNSPLYSCLGSTFELKNLFYWELIANEIGKKLGKTEADLAARHSPFG